jgi:hypothetical protein
MGGERDIDMSSIVRQITKSDPARQGARLLARRAGSDREGSWIKRQWRKAQLTAQVRQPIRWHDLRHQYVSLLIAAGESPKYIAEQAGTRVGFILDTYGHLFETIKPVPVEWPEDLLWPGGPEALLGTILLPADSARTVAAYCHVACAILRRIELEARCSIESH